MIEELELWKHINFLSLYPRNPGSKHYYETQKYIFEFWEKLGYIVIEDKFPYLDLDNTRKIGINIIAKSEESEKPIIIVGAHYDSIENSPGADDNASGVAVLLEISRFINLEYLKAKKYALWYVAFDLEERNMLGSKILANYIQQKNLPVKYAIIFEMLGYTCKKKVIRTIPKLILIKYWDLLLKYLFLENNFIAVVGDENSQDLARIFEKTLSNEVKAINFLAENKGYNFPITRISDHSPFWDIDIPAIMITDTSFLRNPNYHRYTDTLETLDFKFLTKVANGILEGVKRLIGS